MRPWLSTPIWPTSRSVWTTSSRPSHIGVDSQCGPGYLPQYGRQVDLYGQPALGPALPASRNTLGSASQSSSSVSSAPSHSETNNQVAGVDELDTVKTDGQYIYTVSNNTVVIVSAYPVTNAQLVSRISILNQTIDGIFLS